jgi:Ca2+-binding RTX toxin-like protein
VTRTPAAHLPALGALAVLLTSTTVVTLSLPAHAETPTCDGKTATIVGPGPANLTTGTPGDDVIVTVAEAANGTSGRIDSGDGNDTVCVIPGTAPIPHYESNNWFTINTGAGDDKVYIQEPRATSDLSTILGAGSDTYVGNDRYETVSAGDVTPTGWAGYDDAQDTITTAGGTDNIRTGTPGLVNTDIISTGPGRDDITHAGTGTTIDNGTAPGGVTGADDGDRVTFVGNDWKQRQVVFDDRTGTATNDTGEFLRWNNVRIFEVRTDSPLRFIGSDASDFVYLTPTVAPADRATTPVDVSLNGGDDHFIFDDGIAPGRVDGGTGNDTITPGDEDECRTVYATLNRSMTCRINIPSTYTPGIPVTTTAGPAYTVALTDWETHGIFHATRSAFVRGTRDDDTIYARAPRTTIYGRAGNDTLYTHTYAPTYRSHLYGGSGADRLRGGEGRDHLYGGSGTDKMIGGDGRDRLYGGRHIDIAKGKDGRDFCAAEVRRSCEQPRR